MSRPSSVTSTRCRGAAEEADPIASSSRICRLCWEIFQQARIPNVAKATIIASCTRGFLIRLKSSTTAIYQEELRISRQYVCDVEKGRRLVSLEQAARFAKAFGHPPAVLVTLSVRDSIRHSGLKLRVQIEAA